MRTVWRSRITAYSNSTHPSRTWPASTVLVSRPRFSHTSKAPIPRLELPFSPPTSHDSLSTFLIHASKTNLSSTTTTFVGTHYEYTAHAALRRLGLDLVRTGGRADKGIDLLGYWYLPGLPDGWPLRVLVQCKALKKKASPNVVRELEGAFAGARGVRWRDGEGEVTTTKLEQDSEGQEARIKNEADVKEQASNRSVIILLATPQEATKGVREAMSQSRWPMAYLKMSLDGRVEQLLWNRRAADQGLEGISVVTRYIPKDAQSAAGPVGLQEDETEPEDPMEPKNTTVKKPKVMDQEVVMTWKSDVWEWPLDVQREAS
jgi:hypothetical protein